MTLSEIGKLIYQRRVTMNLTQQELAQAVGISRYTLIKLEKGQASDIQFKILESILSALKLNLSVAEFPVSNLPILGET